MRVGENAWTQLITQRSDEPLTLDQGSGFETLTTVEIAVAAYVVGGALTTILTTTLTTVARSTTPQR
jgi:hypothetical protein